VLMAARSSLLLIAAGNHTSPILSSDRDSRAKNSSADEASRGTLSSSRDAPMVKRRLLKEFIGSKRARKKLRIPTKKINLIIQIANTPFLST